MGIDILTPDRTGNFEHIRNKLEDLATGDWVRRSLATPLSSELKFRVQMFQAKYGSNGRILWQVDQGYDEGVHKQIVRGELDLQKTSPVKVNK